MNRKSGRHARNGGFSLVEMLVAVTVMALLGTVILQVFLAADKMNGQAAVLDKAVNLAVDAVERLKAENPATVWNKDTLARIFPDSRIEAEGDGWRIRVLFDEQWQAFSLVRSDWPAHYLQLVLLPNSETGSRTTTVQATVANSGEQVNTPVLEKEPEETLFSMEAELSTQCDGQEATP